MYLRHKVILFRLTSSQEYIFISCSSSGESSPAGFVSVHPFSFDFSSDGLLVPMQQTMERNTVSERSKV